jgi:catechol 2,3-dioxygenase-like lactoylglutathione lyase family enzyme
VIDLNRYVPSTQQLVTEILVRDIRRSTDFYQSLGFTLLRDDGDFVALAWEDHQLFLAQPTAFHQGMQVTIGPPATVPVAGVRVMVPNVDDYWKKVSDIGAPIVIPIADRSYGLRDFTISEPDGFAVRFATRLGT